jgi:fatty acid desaturase 2 (delta-6 desaturase)
MKTIRLDGVVYDITNFNHPGGSIINYAGRSGDANDDAGDAFREFHARSARAKAVLASLPNVADGFGSGSGSDADTSPTTGSSEVAEMTSDYRAMRKQFEDAGYFEPDYIHVYFRLLEIAFFFGVGAFLAPYNIYASMLAFVAFKTRCGWVQHEGGHLSLTGIKSVDRGIQLVTMGFGGGVSSTLWNSMHHKHHAAPQKVKHDIDLDTTPFVAFFDKAFETGTRVSTTSKSASTQLIRLWMRLQAWLFLPVTNGLLVHLFWMYYLHPQRALQNVMSATKSSSSSNINKNAAVAEATAMAASHIVIPLIFYTRSEELGLLYCYFLYMVCNFFNFIYLFGHFSLSHTFTDVISETETPLWFEYAIQHSVNISTKSPLVTWVMGYLNFQIEHHLFPSMPQYKNVLAAPRVREFCKKWNGVTYTSSGSTSSQSASVLLAVKNIQLEYVEVDYWTAWKKMFKNLNDIGIHYYENGFEPSSSTSCPATTAASSSSSSSSNSDGIVELSSSSSESDDDKLKLD